MITRHKTAKLQRQYRSRLKTKGTTARPRLTVFRSLKYIYAQIINDAKGITLAAAFGKDPKQVGEQVAVLAIKKKISAVVFDRGAYQYHGRIRQLADAARMKGLKF
ncbi:MAG: 50S ribosomal protein L18 [Patescibacteria group bacterium]|nr:50S ribosomal protein L18 [Patescibacteria group bacterium]